MEEETLLHFKRTSSEINWGATSVQDLTAASQEDGGHEDRLSDLSKSLILEKKSLSRQLIVGLNKSVLFFSDTKRCRCKRDSQQQSCQQIITLLNSVYKPPEHEFLRQGYDFLSKQSREQSARSQISKDVMRTLGKELSQEYAGRLQEVLQNWVKHRKKVGYVQGMNYIVAALLYHGEEWVAFSVFDMLLYRQGAKSLFLPGLQALTQHVEQLEGFMAAREPVLLKHFRKEEITPMMYAVPWYVSLFTVLIPLELAIRVLSGIVREGLGHLHKVALAYLASKSETLLSLQGPELLVELNSENYRRGENEDWDIILEAACSIPLP